jgi:YYY domain-containing protein
MMFAKRIIRWRPFALFGIALLGFALRLYGLNWDSGNSFHPDERQILFHVTTLSWPTSFAQFLDPVHSPLNPHFFAYGSFPLYLLATLGNILARFYPDISSFSNLTLVGRVLSALFDSGTILLTGWLALLLIEDATPGRYYAWNVAILAATLVAFTPFELQLSHFYAVDTMLLFFVVLTILACVALIDTDAPLRWSFVAGLGYGLALATKFSAAPLAVPLLVAALLRWYRRDFFSALVSLLLASVLTVLAFLIVEPYSLLDMPNFVQQVAEQGNLARGLLDLPYVRQFAGTVPYVYEVQNMVLWGMGVLLGLAALVGLGWLLWLVWRRKQGIAPWLVVLSWVLVYSGITGSFYAKFMRYMLPVYPFLTLMAATLLLTIVAVGRNKKGAPNKGISRFIFPFGLAAIALVLAGTLFQGLALLNVYSQENTRVQASRWMYSHVSRGSVLTYEQWDDPLPVPVGDNDPSMFTQLTYPDASGQSVTGLDLYGDDTTEKAQLLARLLPQVNVITMATDRLDKSIPRLPFRYPLTIHYYQLLFSGQLGFHLAAQFENHPHLFGITLNDSNADESYSVFDHPTVRIFVRDDPYPYTANQLFSLLLEGVHLPPPGAQLSGTEHSLMLSPQQIADDQQSPPFGAQFPADSLANQVPVFLWWLALAMLGVLVFPLVFSAFRTFCDRGYLFSKVLGALLLAYLAWLLASVHLLAFSHASVLLVLEGLLLAGSAAFVIQRERILLFLRQHWRLLLLEECMFSLAYLLFIGIRSLNPDLWHIYLGGEKPMELAFLSAILRSPYMPPLDPWFAGGYINYYYYGYVIFGALIKLTGIVPTTAFNLAIPTLFALTFSGAAAIVYTLTRRFSIALLGGYFAALIGNFNGLIQLKGQLIALLAHMPVPSFNYWQSSRIIPFTINEFPFWSFLFADLHPHVIDMPITVCMLGILATLLFSDNGEGILPRELRAERRILYLLAAFVFGTLACVNPWDMPVYALLLAAVLIIQRLQERGQEKPLDVLIALGFRLITIAFLYALSYLFYLPFYSWYQELYVNGVGLVKAGTSMSDYLTIFGLWIFLAASFFFAELYQRLFVWWWRAKRGSADSSLYALLCSSALVAFVLLGLEILLVALLALGSFLFVTSVWSRYRVVPKWKEEAQDANIVGRASTYTYLLLIMGVGICLGMELVYVRDFLDGGDYERMNTVFKFSIQAWLCFAIGGALVVSRLWSLFGSFVRRAWSVVVLVLILGCSVFLIEGTAARIHDHQGWVDIQQPVLSASYIPTIDGFAFVRAWYPADAKAIEWINAHISGSPVLLEAAAPVSYQWYNRISVFTGLPDVLGWPDHVGEQRYDYQPLNRITDIGLIYSTRDSAQAVELLHYYHVRYIYVGPMERQLYAQQSSAGLDKFDHMVGDTLRVVYRSDGVTIYEVL